MLKEIKILTIFYVDSFLKTENKFYNVFWPLELFE